MPNFKKAINDFLLKHIKINGLPVDSYIEECAEVEARRRSKHWLDEKNDLAKACQQLNDIIFKRDEEISALKSQISGVPTKQEAFNKHLDSLIESGELQGHNLTPNQVSKQNKQETLNNHLCDEAEAKGRENFYADYGLLDNPYTRNSNQFLAWAHGFIDAKKTRDLEFIDKRDIQGSQG